MTTGGEPIEENAEGGAHRTSQVPTKGLHYDATQLSDKPTPAFGEFRSSDHFDPETPEPEDRANEAEGKEDEDPLLDQIVGNYEIRQLLGRGGFGNVYKAWDNSLKRWAALKFLKMHLHGEHLKSFQTEAQVIANLAKNPLIVQIYALDIYHGNFYFALEYLQGSADRLIKLNPNGLPVAQALSIAADCAEGLAYAHENTVLHRDIKPANILIDEETTKRAKLADFGLARFYNMGTSSHSHVIAGTPPYMSPEQASGERVDHRSDVYSLGVTLYEMLSGKLPHKAKSSQEMLERARRGGGTPLPAYRPDLPREIHDLVAKATAKKPERRFQTAKEFESAIRAVLRSLSETGTTSGASSVRRRPERAAWGVIALTAVIAAIVVGGLLNGKGSEVTVPPAQKPDGPVQLALASLNAGDYDSATTSLSAFLDTQPSDPDAQYALGFAHYVNGRTDEAEAAFQLLTDPASRADADAMLAHARQGAGARPELERLAELDSAYASVLLGGLDVAGAKFDSAAARLSSIDINRLRLDWQKAQCQQLLGRAYLKLADYAKAFESLSLASKSDAAPVAEMAVVFADMAKQQMAGDRREEVRSQIERIKKLVTELPEVAPNSWTSRPIRVWIKPGGNASPLAASLGVADALPSMLARNLTESESETLIGVVNRENIGDILFEQELSQLESELDRTAVGQVMGARVLAVCSYESIFGDQQAVITLTDLESTKMLGAVEMELTSGLHPREWVSEIDELVIGEIKNAYRLQGILTEQSGELTIDIGTNLGVTPGMSFEIFRTTDARIPLSNVSVTVEGEPDSQSATVTPQNFEPSSIPKEGWFVREFRAAVESAEDSQ